jgi:hypothetical protein
MWMGGFKEGGSVESWFFFFLSGGVAGRIREGANGEADKTNN